MKSKISKIIVSIVGGITITYLTVFLPFGGPALNLTAVLSCGDPSGLPFSFTAVHKEPFNPDIPAPFCLLEFDYIVFILDSLIWVATLFFALSYLNKYLKRKNNQNV